MTVATKVQQTIASAEGVLANLKTFALDTDDQTAKDMFNNLAQQQQTILDNLKGRLNYIQEQEPQYKQQ